VVALAVGWPAAARAQDFPPITSRDYTLDLYQGGVVASFRIVGMGGVAVGAAEGAGSMAMNPASPAVRHTASHDWWDWDVSFEALAPDLGDDFDGNGVPQTDEDARTFSSNVGGVVQFGRWGFGLSVISEEHALPVTGGMGGTLTVLYGHVQVARTFGAGDAWTVGLGVAGGTLRIDSLEGGDPRRIVDEGSTALEAGVLWRPPGRRLRLGASLRLPLAAELEPPGCDPLDCGGYILPERIAVPWTFAVGVAWRFAPTPWNIKVDDDWRDEKGLIVAADVVVTGGTDRGAGIEAFVAHRLQASGRDRVDVSLRVGAEHEIAPGWVRIRAGSYYEPGRFSGVEGRLHGTMGFDLRLLSFCFWGDRYRLRLSFAADAARQYANVITSIGFWH
jgi:hypothetical protein